MVKEEGVKATRSMVERIKDFFLSESVCTSGAWEGYFELPNPIEFHVGLWISNRVFSCDLSFHGHRLVEWRASCLLILTEACLIYTLK